MSTQEQPPADAFELIKMASGKKPGAWCPGCQQQFATRWSGKRVSDHMQTCEALKKIAAK